MELMNKQEETVTLKRMEPTDDKESNKKLFEMYANLVKPLKSIENKMAACEKLRYQGYLVRSKKENYVVILVLAVVLFIMSLIVLSNLNIDKIYPFMHQYPLLENVLFLSMLISVIGSFIICIAVSNSEDRKKQKELSDLENKFNDLRNEINSDIKILEPYLQYVPPAYRSSHALGYFVDSYINVRVENLSEAVKAYDNYVHQQNVQQGFKQIDARLREISYMQKQSLASMHVGINLGAMCLWL